MTRKMVTVRKVLDLKSIDGADFIELAIVDGWQCVVKKGEFKVGDYGLYFEIDSFLPENDVRYQFLAKSVITWEGNKGIRIKTAKFKGQISQGLLLPLSSFPDIKPTMLSSDKDWAEKLGVLKWERESDKPTTVPKKNWLTSFFKKLKYTRLKPAVLWLEKTFPSLFNKKMVRGFPSFIPKTDEERIQNRFYKLDRNDGHKWRATIKLDGSSMTVYKFGKEKGVCSRNFKVFGADNKYVQTASTYSLPNAVPDGLAIQGELMGPGIQGNKENLLTHRFYVFKIWNINEQRYLLPAELDSLCGELGLEQVPDLGFYDLSTFDSVQKFLEFAEGLSLSSPIREGVVFSRDDGKDSFKAISNAFLLKYKD